MRSSLELYTRAGELTTDDVQRAEILAEMAKHEADMGMLEASHSHSRAAEDIFASHGLTARRAEVLAQHSHTFWLEGDKPSGDEHLRLAMEAIDGLDDGPEVAHVLRQYTNKLFIEGNWEEAAEIGERALAVSRRFSSPSDVGRALRALGSALTYGPDRERGIEMLSEAYRIGMDLGDMSYAYAANNLHAFLQVMEGPETALAVIEPAVEFLELRGQKASLDFTRSSRVESLVWLGRWDEAESELREVIDHDLARGGTQIVTMARNLLMPVFTYQGRYQEAYALIEPTMERSREIRDPQVLLPSLSAAIHAAARSGHPDEARRLITELEGIAGVGSSPTVLATMLLPGVDSIRELDRPALERMAALSERRFALCDRSLDAVLAAIDQSYGRHDVASERLSGAVLGFEKLSAPVFAHQCRILEARSRIDLGEEDTAAGLLRAAEAFFEPVGGRHFLDAIETIRSEPAA
ncbi:MAG: hypothetical protein OEQ47_01510 [Acidimicrobiia bacterium]|nr:hypothetical protein [Acidimicrobiia bacterium]